jgi:threonine aldolase
MPDAPALKTHFASDNTAGICPEAWEATAQANRAVLNSSYWVELACQGADRAVQDYFGGNRRNSLWKRLSIENFQS